MPTLLWILAATAAGGALSALFAALVLLVPESRRNVFLPHLVSFATGALLGAALLTLLPRAIETVGLERVHLIGIATVGGILAFFVLEKLVLWRHFHVGDSHGVHVEAQRQQASGVLILTGDAIHNLIDGVLIAAAFLYSVPTGIAASVAVIAHEIPQEVGDFAILLHAGMSRRRAFALNLLTSLTSVVGGVIAYFALSPVQDLLPYALAVAAACFLYVAVADLIPGLHRRIEPLATLQQVVLIAVGIAAIVLTDLH